jgi:hypothetical protein
MLVAYTKCCVVFMLRVVKLSVITLSVMAPHELPSPTLSLPPPCNPDPRAGYSVKSQASYETAAMRWLQLQVLIWRERERGREGEGE